MIFITAEHILPGIASLVNMMRIAGGYYAGSARHSEALATSLTRHDNK